MPRTAIGLPSFDRQDTVGAAVDSLLAQTDSDLVVVVSDDGSTDATLEHLLERAAVDHRLIVRTGDRLGLVGNWNRALSLARSAAPDAEYFAWGSDHDFWESTWLAELVSALDRNPRAVLAYPTTTWFGSTRSRAPRIFDTAGTTDPAYRLRMAASRMAAGDMVYGLFRLSALDAVGGLPRTIFPDRLLLARLALHGEFVQLPSRTWWRREARASVPARQRKTLFGRSVPWHTRLPWWAVHAALLRHEAGLAGSVGYACRGAWLSAHTLPWRVKQALLESTHAHGHALSSEGRRSGAGGQGR